MCKISLHFYDLLLNANVCDLFYDIDNLDFASFSDILGQLKGGIGKIFDWFKKNVLKGNADKCHLELMSDLLNPFFIKGLTASVYKSDKMH